MKETSHIKCVEHYLGFETEFLMPEGLLSEKIQMIQTKNTRRTNKTIEERIRRYWDEKRQGSMFDGDRARYEGFCYNETNRQLKIFYSHEKYRTYLYASDSNLPRPYQAELLSINGVVLTKDDLIPIGLRTAETNQQGVWHIIPAGYIDTELVVSNMIKSGESKQGIWNSEAPQTATERELHEELTLPKKAVDISRMKVIGIVFNYKRDYDTTVCVVVPVDCNSDEIALKGDEHEKLRFLKTTVKSLKEELMQLSGEPNTSSGHLRGDIALTIAHLHGHSEYVKTLENVYRESS